MKKTAIILSGCGQVDGSETHETILTILALEQHNLDWEGLAPSGLQTEVYDHYTNTKENISPSSMITEAARLVRGNITIINAVNASDYAAVIIPGGAGVIKNLSNYSTAGINFTIHPELLAFMATIVRLQIPAGFICIAPILIPKLYGNKPKLTIGSNVELAAKIVQIGGEHCDCLANDIVIDHAQKIVSTPANMVAKNIVEVYHGIYKLVTQIANWIN